MAKSAEDQFSAVFDVLSHERRRRLILVMAISQESTLTVRYLAEFLTVLNTGAHPREIDARTYQTERQSLTKTHLDVLEDAGVIDQDETTVSRGPVFEAVRDLLLVALQRT